MKTPPEIRILTDDVANKIAAGEVVERPASAVKELLENSVDAGATRIEVEFRHGGKSFVKVFDNGCGMTRQQALTSLEPHATSKIRAPEDLFRISSYGFRGEAVPSIASVSRFKMRTRPESLTFGTEIDVYAGSVNSVRDCGMAAGTEISVENLFCSVPARRKFLKSDNVEASHIVKLCRLYALALPDLSITLVEDGRTVFRSESNLKIIDRIERVAGSEVSSKLFELNVRESCGMRVSGALLRAGESFPTNRNICSFINGRPVECRAVYSAIKEAYTQFVPKGRYAAAFLFIDLPPESVDVNVHPAKREVRLKNEFAVRDFLLASISDALAKSGSDIGALQPHADKNFQPEKTAAIAAPTPRAIPKPAFSPRDEIVSTPIVKAPTSVCTPAPTFVKTPAITPREDKNSAPDIPAAPQKSPTAPAEKPKLSVENWRYAGSFKKRFALFETQKGLVILSVSAALKRVAYERIMRGLKGGDAPSQTLLLPVNLRFERGDDEYFSANRDAFEACGFKIEDFGKAFYRIAAAPTWIPYGEVENFVRDFVEIARVENRSLKKAKLSDETFAAYLVKRRGASNFEISESSATELLGELLASPKHASSPDGHPTMREISESELARMFSL